MFNVRATSLKRINYGLHAGGVMVAITILGACYFLAIQPMEQRQATLGAQIQVVQTLHDRGDSIRTNYRNVTSALADHETKFRRVIARIPETPRESEFLAQITELARSCQFRIQRFHPMEPVNEGTHTALEVQLDASATYAGICRFLDGLRTLDRLCRVARLHLQAASADGAELPMKMTLRIYYVPPSKTAVLEADRV